MAGIKGQKSGGFGGRKIKGDEKRDKYINFKVSEKEKEFINSSRKKEPLADFFLKLINKKNI